MVDEAERSLHDAFSVLSQTVKETRVVLGGGCSEMLMSNAADEAAKRVSGKKAIAVESFARALRQASVTRSTQVPDDDDSFYHRFLSFWRTMRASIHQT